MTPAFSSFRELMDKWAVALEMLQENDLCMFFKKDSKVYGATESGRITFARMRNPESKDDLNWKKDASMILYDLDKAPGENKIVVGSYEIDDFKPISQEDAEKMMKKKGKDMPSVEEDDDDDDNYYGEE